jgi:hypothetical protein
MAALKLAGKTAAGAVPLAQLARLGLPALAGLLAFAALVLAAMCWILSSDARSGRVTRVLQACRSGTASAQDAVSPPAMAGPASHRKRPHTEIGTPVWASCSLLVPASIFLGLRWTNHRHPRRSH